LKTEMAACLPAVPDTSPAAVRTGVRVASVIASVTQAAAIAATAKRFIAPSY
jgi:hypothetical protein